MSGFTVVLIDSEEGSEGDFIYVHSASSADELAECWEEIRQGMALASRVVEERDAVADADLADRPTTSEFIRVDLWPIAERGRLASLVHLQRTSERFRGVTLCGETARHEVADDDEREVCAKCSALAEASS